jgi:uncharacterized membrane protein
MPKLMTNMLQIRISTCVKFIAIVALSFVFTLGGSQTTLAQEEYDSLYYAGWSINYFDAEIEVHEDATATVVETIQTTFNEAWDKHGIFREIPIRYHDDLYNAVNMDLDVVSVLQNGEPAQYSVSKFGNDLRIKIGDPDVTISGDVTYQITYEVGRVFLYFDDRDELYWNVTGDEWEVPIYNVTAVVVLPDGAEIVDSACYTGYEGSTDQNCGSAQEGSVVAFAADDFLTIAVGFEKNIIYVPTMLERIGWFLSDNWYAAIPFFLTLLMILLWWRHGKDPKMDTVIAEYEPPEGIWAAYAGAIASNKFTTQQVTAMIVQLAVKGYLKIHVNQEEGKILKIKRNKTSLEKVKSSDGLDEAHKLIYQAIFQTDKKTVELKDIKSSKAAAKVRKAKKALEKKLIDDGIYAKQSFKFRFFIMTVGGVGLYFSMAFGAAVGMLTGVMIVVAATTFLVLGFLMPKRTHRGTDLARNILGFKLFMHTAERYRSQWQEKEHIFAEYLPYAIVFNDTKHWAKVFENFGMDNNPDWYVSNVAFVNSIDFTKSLNAVSAGIIATSRASSSYSSSSGGGFSGGGMGGGGGGSW